MNKEFEIFKKEFNKWYEKFGLIGYRIYFEYKELNEFDYGDITTERESMVATVRLNSKVNDTVLYGRDIKRTAKHEAIHLMVNRLADVARDRYATDKEIYSAEEELVIKLEKLIN